MFDRVRMELARTLVPPQNRKRKRRKHEVSVYKEPGSEIYYFRDTIHTAQGPKRIKRSTEQTTLQAALRQAKIIRDKELKGEGRAVQARPGYATVGQVLGVWLLRSPAKTRRNNASAVRKWVRSFAADEPDGVSMARLSAEMLERYLQAWPGSPEGRASTWRQIRAVFADQPLRWYRQEGLVLPDLTEFRLVRAESSAREQQFEGFTPIGPEVLAKMDAAAELLRRSADAEERKLWAVYALMRWCGLRNSEAVDVQWEWLLRGQQNYLWRFERRAVEPVRAERMRKDSVQNGFYLPKGRPGDVPVRRRLLGQLRRALDSRRSGFVIPRLTRTEGDHLVERRINDFVRPFFPEANAKEKKAYKLRGQFGAEYCRLHGLEATSRVMRHRDYKTTWKHYHALLNEPAPL